MVADITTQIVPLVRSLVERYKPQDIVQAMLGSAFDLHLEHEKIPTQALNNFRALAEHSARARLGGTANEARETG